MFLSDRHDWFKSSNIRKKLPRKKSSRLLSPSGEMPLMMNTNSKILPSQDSNLSCYSPSTLTSTPAFYLSSFMILVGGRFPFPKNTDNFYVMVAKVVTGESPTPPQKIALNKLPPGRLPPLKLPRGGWVRVGVRQFTGGNFLKSSSLSFSQREAAFQG